MIEKRSEKQGVSLAAASVQVAGRPVEVEAITRERMIRKGRMNGHGAATAPQT